MDNELRDKLRMIFRNGFYGGAAALYLASIGMVEAFDLRLMIGTFLSLGDLMVVIGAIGAGILLATKMKGEAGRAVLPAAALAGAISSIPLLLLILLTQFISLRAMFVNISPALIEIITFGQGALVGSLMLVLLSALMGVLGAGLLVLTPRWRGAVVNALIWTLGIALFSENVAQILRGIAGRGVVRLIFQNKALYPSVALLIFAISFALSFWLKSVMGERRAAAKLENITPSKSKRIRGFILIGLALIALPWVMGLFLSQALFMVGLYVMMGLGLNIVVGYAGLLDLGYVAFFAIGAYVMGVLTTTSELGLSDLNFWGALPFCLLAGLLWGVMLGFPVLRMRGDYLAIVTLGFGEIIRILATSDWLAPIEGGPQGVLHIPKPVIAGFSMDSPQSMYYLVLIGIGLAAFVTLRLRESRLGRQWMAMREDEDVAEAMGINLVSTKLLAFAIGGAFSALAGGIFAARLGNIFPHSLNLIWSINALALIIVGGLGSIPGVVVGAAILVGLPELLREFAEYRLLMYGILLIVMMLVRPEGFLPEKRRVQELHAEDGPVQDVVLGSLGE